MDIEISDEANELLGEEYELQIEVDEDDGDVSFLLFKLDRNRNVFDNVDSMSARVTTK